MASRRGIISHGSGTSSLRTTIQSSLQVPKLAKGVDFENWAFKFIRVLKVDNLDRIVLEDHKRPHDDGTEETRVILKCMAIAEAAIVNNIDDSMIEIIRATTEDPEVTPYKMWCALRDFFMGSKTYTVRSLRQQLYTTKMNEETTLMSYIDTLNRICQQLHALGARRDDEDRLVVFINGLHHDIVNKLFT